MFNILFVCSGNTCRSSMAEALGKKMLKERNLADKIKISSAGTGAYDGMPASDFAIQVMDEMGLDLRGHNARIVTQEMVEEADIILAMKVGHKDRLQRMNPTKGDSIFTLGEYILEDDVTVDRLEDLDIGDPFGGTVDVYRECALELKEHIREALDKILSKIGE